MKPQKSSFASTKNTFNQKNKFSFAPNFSRKLFKMNFINFLQDFYHQKSSAIFVPLRKTKSQHVLKNKKNHQVKTKFLQLHFNEASRINLDLERILGEFRQILQLPEEIQITIKIGRKARRVLGSVKLVSGISRITISRFLCDFRVPEFVLQEVILHELIHIKTGHGSTLQKEYQHAHRGGVIRKEMKEVGQEELFLQSDEWVKANWYHTVGNYRRRETLLNKNAK